MKTIAVLAIAVALIVMAGVAVYDSPEMVCARHRDRALEKYAPEPMNRSRYRVHLVESIEQAEGKPGLARKLETRKNELANFDPAYQKYLENAETVSRLAKSAIAKKYASCRGDWTLKPQAGVQRQ